MKALISSFCILSTLANAASISFPLKRVPLKQVDPPNPDPVTTDEFNTTMGVNDPLTYLNTLQVEVGVPRQQLSLMLDINYYMPFLYQSNCYQYHNVSYNCSVYPFSINQTYNYNNSLTFNNYTEGRNNTSFYYNSGFRLDAALAADQFCQVGSQWCFNCVFGNVKDLRQNYYFKYVELPDVNGVMGAGYFPESAQMNSLWQELLSKGSSTKMALSFVASEFDMEYLPHELNYDSAQNEFIMGDYNTSLYVDSEQPTMSMVSADLN